MSSHQLLLLKEYKSGIVYALISRLRVSFTEKNKVGYYATPQTNGKNNCSLSFSGRLQTTPPLMVQYYCFGWPLNPSVKPTSS